jgi:hypothetical protein
LREGAIPAAIAAALVLATIALRLAQIDGLALPLWVDSVHHGLLVRVAAETGAVPLDLRPYLPIDELPYHWGYHILTATSMQVSGESLPHAMLWMGQVLNGLMVLVVAGLACELWGTPWAALPAIVAVGMVSYLPAYYVSWGRYTQLTGLLLLPPLASAWRMLLRRPTGRAALLAGLLAAGLVLTHYRVLIFGAPLLVVLSLDYLAGQRLRAALVWCGLLAIGCCFVFTAPWLLVLARRVLLPAVAAPGSLAGEGGFTELRSGLIWLPQNALLFGLAGLGALGALWRRRRTAAAVLGWVAAMFLLANPGWAGLPTTWLLTNDAVSIMLFMPAGLLAGALALPTAQRGPRLGTIAVAATLALGAWGAWQQWNIVNPTTNLASEADVAAITWADSHTPPDARFLVGAVSWLSGLDRGDDAGPWLLPLAGRWTTVAPPLYIYGTPEYREATLAMQQAAAALPLDNPVVLREWLRSHQIGYLYIGSRSTKLAADTFRNQLGYELLYEADGAAIFGVR